MTHSESELPPLRVPRAHLHAVAPLLFTLLATPGVALSAPHEVLADVASALEAGDATRLLACLSDGGRRRYAQVLQAARAGATKEAIAGLDVPERALARGAHRLGRDVVSRAESLEELAEIVVRDRGDWKEPYARLSLGMRAQTSSRSRMIVRVDGAPVPILVDLVPERGSWKVDRVTTPIISRDSVRLASALFGSSEEQALDMLVDRSIEVLSAIP